MTIPVPARREPLLPGAFYRYWYPLLALSRRELRKRYATTVFGALWTVLLPLATLAIYLTVFVFILRSGRSDSQAWHFAVNMLAGLLPFQAFADGLQRACPSLREDRALLDREQFPAEVVAASRVLSTSVSEVAGLALLLLAVALHGEPPGPLVLLLPLAIALRILLTVGIGWFVSILSVFIADVAEVLGFVLTAWLFLTPIFYSAEALPPALAWTLTVNPLHHLVSIYRALLVHGPFDSSAVAILLVWAVAAAAAGLWMHRATIDRAKDFL
ncbi:ABC transporter permease [Massilia sp. DWR3-1-1]|uniref:ABC transporter permease n=1 Tax=Massilia sp. DWR3-1-1 TaxID=2804559 RepID=UPI003CED32FD